PLRRAAARAAAPPGPVAVGKVGREVDADARAQRVARPLAAPRAAHPGRIGRPGDDARRALTAHAHDGAAVLDAGPLAVVGTPRVTLRAALARADERWRVSAAVDAQPRLGGPSAAPPHAR